MRNQMEKSKENAMGTGTVSWFKRTGVAKT